MAAVEDLYMNHQSLLLGDGKVMSGISTEGFLISDQAYVSTHILKFMSEIGDWQLSKICT